MDNLDADDAEKNAKVSDSAYSNSCSNSQTRRSNSSKSGSNSSGSSGYGGKHSTSGSSNNLNQPDKRKDGKKKNHQPLTVTATAACEVEAAHNAPKPTTADPPLQETNDVLHNPESLAKACELESIEVFAATLSESSAKEDTLPSSPNANQPNNPIDNQPPPTNKIPGFTYVISMLDGIVMYTTPTLTTCLGFPKDMCVGRSFIDFIHPKDRNTFASQITSGLVCPKTGTAQGQGINNSVTTRFCRIRKYRGLAEGYGVKEGKVVYLPFQLKMTYKNQTDERKEGAFLVLRATPVLSAYKKPNETISRSVPFVLRHLPSGAVDYVDPASVPYLGFLPQDIIYKDALKMYHNDDLSYLKQIYSLLVKEGAVASSKPFRMLTHNGDYIKCETEWSSFTNPWSKKLEYVIGKHYVVEGPTNPDVFQECVEDVLENLPKISEVARTRALQLRKGIIKIIEEDMTKTAQQAKQQMTKRCQNITNYIERMAEENTQSDGSQKSKPQSAPEDIHNIRNSISFSAITLHHDYVENKMLAESLLNYNQLNYNETLQRYFDTHQPFDRSPTDNEDASATSNRVTQSLVDSSDFTSSCDSSGFMLPASENGDAFESLHSARLTKHVINKHNKEMEKDLLDKYRENRSRSKMIKDKISVESRQKKNEHIARCNAPFLLPNSEVAIPQAKKTHGIKRAATANEEFVTKRKYHCPGTQWATMTSPKPITISNADQQPATTQQIILQSERQPQHKQHTVQTADQRTCQQQDQPNLNQFQPTADPGPSTSRQEHHLSHPQLYYLLRPWPYHPKLNPQMDLISHQLPREPPHQQKTYQLPQTQMHNQHKKMYPQQDQPLHQQPYQHPHPQQHPNPHPQPHPQTHPQPNPQPHPQPNPQPNPQPYPQPHPQPHPQPNTQPHPQPHQPIHQQSIQQLHQQLQQRINEQWILQMNQPSQHQRNQQPDQQPLSQSHQQHHPKPYQQPHPQPHQQSHHQLHQQPLQLVHQQPIQLVHQQAHQQPSNKPQIPPQERLKLTAMQPMVYESAQPPTMLNTSGAHYLTPNPLGLVKQATTITARDAERHGMKRGTMLHNQHPCKLYCDNQRQALPRHSSTQTPKHVQQNGCPRDSFHDKPQPTLGFELSQQMPLLTPAGSNQGMYLFCYPTNPQAYPSTAAPNNNQPAKTYNNMHHDHPCPKPFATYGDAKVFPPIMLSTADPPIAFPLDPASRNQAVHFVPTPPAMQVTRPSIIHKAGKNYQYREQKIAESQETSSFCEQYCASTEALKRSTETVPELGIIRETVRRFGESSDDTLDRTDGDSRSSFYSIFLNTDSTSAGECGDHARLHTDDRKPLYDRASTSNISQTNVSDKETKPSWFDKVRISSEQLNKYQMLTKSMNDVLLADKAKMPKLGQPTLVNDQLNQLYSEMQLQGGAPRLTLEEGITSSGSSGEENCLRTNTLPLKKREHSKLVMMYEADAPLPPPNENTFAPVPNATF